MSMPGLSGIDLIKRLKAGEAEAAASWCCRCTASSSTRRARSRPAPRATSPRTAPPSSCSARCARSPPAACTSARRPRRRLVAGRGSAAARSPVGPRVRGAAPAGRGPRPDRDRRAAAPLGEDRQHPQDAHPGEARRSAAPPSWCATRSRTGWSRKIPTVACPTTDFAAARRYSPREGVPGRGLVAAARAPGSRCSRDSRRERRRPRRRREDAIDAILAARPDAVVLDIHLAEGNGFDVLRAAARGCAAAIYVLTNYPLDGYRRRRSARRARLLRQVERDRAAARRAGRRRRRARNPNRKAPTLNISRRR